MKKFISLGFILIFLLNTFCVFAENDVPEVLSKSAILVQEGTGRIMYEKNADEKVYPASTTKVMTAILAIEALDPSSTLAASEEAIQIDRDGSNMGILRDELLTVEQLLYGLLVHSANDAANVLAEAVAGTVPAFIEKMNEKAKELGMNNTHFVNAHGYHDPEHYTTARDMM
ncbi:MAG: D-alanyl-D-alanine carboxypeptidase, partial [Clostridia bacterium]|nr:D-alanyl-D-alanine carboxypeptidase [Clostridia bacterium]